MEDLRQLMEDQAAEFRGIHERLAAIVTTGVDLLAALELRIAAIEDNQETTHHAIIKAVAMAAHKRGEDHAIPPIPPELAAACARPAGTINRVVLDVLHREVTRTVAGGRDPGEVWRDLYLSVRDHVG